MNKQLMRFAVLSILFIIPFTKSLAQGTYSYTTTPNPHLYSPFNNTINCTNTSNPTWSPGNCFENWSASNGTPQALPSFFSAPTNPIDVVRLYKDPIMYPYTEGTFHSFQFQPGLRYNIKVGIDYIPVAIGGTIEIWAINDIATYKAMPGINLNVTPPYSNEYNTPVAPLQVPQLLGRYTVNTLAWQSSPPTGNNASGGGIQSMQWAFTSPEINTGSMYNEVLIISHSLPNNTATDIYVDYLDICMGGDVVYDITQPNPIQPQYTRATNIWAGDPSVSPVGITVPTYRNTEFYAFSTILTPNFFAMMEADYYFLVTPRTDNCPTTGYPILSGLSKPGRSYLSDPHKDSEYKPFHPGVGTNDNQVNNITIYPNPTTGSFNIELPQRGNYTIRVMNMLGCTVYEGQMADEQKKSIQLDASLPPGNYTIHISGDGLRHVERITLVK